MEKHVRNWRDLLRLIGSIELFTVLFRIPNIFAFMIIIHLQFRLLLFSSNGNYPISGAQSRSVPLRMP